VSDEIKEKLEVVSSEIEVSIECSDDITDDILDDIVDEEDMPEEDISKIKENTESDRLYNFLQDPLHSSEEIEVFLKTINGAGWSLLGCEIGPDGVRGKHDRLNFGSVNKNTTVEGTIGEVVVNAKDSITELAIEKIKGKPEYDAIMSDQVDQREASKILFGVPLEGLSQLSKKEIGKIAKQVGVITLHQNTTLDVRDFGIGVEPSDFTSTILSIEKGNKINKFYNTGTYGFGGSSSSAKSFCDYSVFISKKWKSKDVGITIIRYQDPEIDEKTGNKKEKTGQYWFLHIDGKIPTVRDDSFAHGTLKRHFGQQISEVVNKSQQGDGSIYAMIRTMMPTTCLPIYLRDAYNYPKLINIKARKKGKLMPMIGIQDALINRHDRDSKNEYENSDVKKVRVRYLNRIERPLDNNDPKSGKIGILYAVINNNKETGAGVRTYVNPLKPILLSEGGQSRGKIGNETLSGTKLHYLRKNVIVVVSLDDVPIDIRMNMFGSNREDVKRIWATKLNHIIKEVLETDPEVVAINDELRDQENFNTVEQKDFQNRNLLVRFLDLTKKVVKGKNKPLDPNGDPPVIDIDPPKPMEVLEIPTILDFCRNKEIILPPGRATTLTCITNAPRDYISYISSADSRIGFLIDGAPAKASSVITECSSRQIDDFGRFHVLIKASENAKIGDTGKIEVFLNSKLDGRRLDSTISYVIGERKKGSTSSQSLPEVDIIPVDYNEPEDAQRWESMSESSCFNVSEGDKGYRNKVSYSIIPKGDDFTVLLNVNAPQYSGYYPDNSYKNNKFQALVKSELQEYVAIQSTSCYYDTPEPAVGDCSEDVDNFKHFYNSNILSHICFSAFCKIEKLKK